VATPPNPPATRALLDRFAAFTGRTLDLRELAVASEAWKTRVDSAVDGDEDMRDYVRRLEAQVDIDEPEPVDPDEIPSGETLAAQFEEYLREQDTE
jgi:hypothetical protein